MIQFQFFDPRGTFFFSPLPTQEWSEGPGAYQLAHLSKMSMNSTHNNRSLSMKRYIIPKLQELPITFVSHISLSWIHVVMLGKVKQR